MTMLENCDTSWFCDKNVIHSKEALWVCFKSNLCNCDKIVMKMWKKEKLYMIIEFLNFNILMDNQADNLSKKIG